MLSKELEHAYLQSRAQKLGKEVADSMICLIY